MKFSCRDGACPVSRDAASRVSTESQTRDVRHLVPQVSRFSRLGSSGTMLRYRPACANSSAADSITADSSSSASSDAVRSKMLN
jgi:hypothetical protein